MAAAEAKATRPARPFGKLAYLYVGTKDVEAALTYWTDVVGAPRVWDFAAFGTRVAAVAPGDGPLLLLAGHLEPGTSIPIYAVDDLDATMGALKKKGWKPSGDAFGIPDGPCIRFDDPGGNPFAIYQPTRPNALAHEFQAENEEKREEGRRRGR